jgi:uncharacterized protein with GYD domain
MGRYAFDFSYTDTSWAKLIANPSDRSEAVAATVRDLGGQFQAMYYSFGEHDGVVIGDFDDPADAAAFSIALTPTGALASLRTQQLIPAAYMPAVLAKAATAQGSYVKRGE